MAKKKPMTKRRQAEQIEKEKKAKTKKIIIITSIVASVILLTLGIILIATCGGDGNAPKPTTATIDVANYGTIEIKLNSENAPKTVENFIKLAEKGFYNNKSFDSISGGSLSAGKDTNNECASIYGEFKKNGYNDNAISHKKGVISMNRGDDYNSASSSFFILTEDKTEYDGLFAAFGEVVSGVEIVEKIASDMEANPEKVAPTITLVSITRK